LGIFSISSTDPNNFKAIGNVLGLK